MNSSHQFTLIALLERSWLCSQPRRLARSFPHAPGRPTATNAASIVGWIATRIAGIGDTIAASGDTSAGIDPHQGGTRLSSLTHPSANHGTLPFFACARA
jgi:hypothetical protein